MQVEADQSARALVTFYMVPLHRIFTLHVVGINPSDTPGLWPDPIVRFRPDDIPHFFSEPFRDHGFEVEIS